MRVDTNGKLSRAAGIQDPTPPQKAPTGSNEVDLAESHALDAALKATSEVRAEQVARAKALIRNPGYPSHQVLDQVAELLAKRIRNKE
jgi:hypothetical protein